MLRTSHPQLRQMTQEELLNHQQQQIVNRYATVGRNGHFTNGNTYYGVPQYYPPQQQQQQQQQQQTIQAQVLQQVSMSNHFFSLSQRNKLECLSIQSLMFGCVPPARW
jgi:hypothetical protein